MTCIAGFTSWDEYYKAVSGNPPRETLVRALDAWEKEFGARRMRTAVDLGCGEGRDTVELLRRRFHVRAIDSEQRALDWLAGRADLPTTGTLETVCARMEDAAWPAVEVFNASFALPFCTPDCLEALWARIVAALPQGGRFAGQIFGPDDEWASPALGIRDRAAVEAMLAAFEPEQLDEINRPGKDAMGGAKHWHIFYIVARKR
ncbi:MAG: methyltransferase domain-containing protein [Alphaproteobacteria bacterium]|nr:methyltransferase domain-containing protein [Alphaproteobacteria bacterium]